MRRTNFLKPILVRNPIPTRLVNCTLDGIFLRSFATEFTARKLHCYKTVHGKMGMTNDGNPLSVSFLLSSRKSYES